MSREIKFRVWDKVEKRYRRIVGLNYDDGELVSITVYDPGDFAPTILPLERVILEQSTGLKDKNGKEICEGDIVEWVNGLGEKHIFEIMWNECRATFQMAEIGQEYPYILQGLSDKMKPYCEVIGNIHENPELLGGEE